MKELVLNNISKSYKRPVLCNISYTFTPGKLYVIKGVSGSGKSTLFNIIGGLETDFSGDIQFDGSGCLKKDKYRRKVGYIYQNSLLLSNVTVNDNLRLIKNDQDKIKLLAERLNISDLLMRTPEKLSGGERQRVSILRSLLYDPEILLADEPTASLDGQNSRNIASLLSELKCDGRIILVATHEHYFDQLADEILYLRGGRIEHVEKNPTAYHAQRGGTDTDKTVETDRTYETDETGETKKGRRFDLLHFIIKRRRSSFRLSSLIPLSIVVLLILVVSTVQNSFEKEYIRASAMKTNSDFFSINEENFKKLDGAVRERMRVYYDYYYEENGVTANYLADKKDSIFALDGMIKYGEFPDSDNEILVSKEYLDPRLKPGEDASDRIGSTVTYAGREFVISGILYSFSNSDDEGENNTGKNDDYLSVILSDYYYKTIDIIDGLHESESIFILHDVIASFGDKRTAGIYHEDYNILNVSYPELFMNPHVLEYLHKFMRESLTIFTSEEDAEETDITINDFDRTAGQLQKTIDSVALIMLLIFYICFAIFCIFIKMQIGIELFYRRREIGYLQIFNVQRNEIYKMIVIEYGIRFIASVVLAFILYASAAAVYLTIAQDFVIFNLSHIALVLSSAFLFYMIASMLAVHSIMNRRVIELVRE